VAIADEALGAKGLQDENDALQVHEVILKEGLSTGQLHFLSRFQWLEILPGQACQIGEQH